MTTHLTMALNVLALTLLGCATHGSSALASPPSPPTSASSEPFDEGAARRRYEAWMLQWAAPPFPDHGPTAPPPPQHPFAQLRARHETLPIVPHWPIDPARGLLVNDLPKAPKKLRWAETGVESHPDSDAHPALDWTMIALSDPDHVDAISPVLCVPEACYFTSPVVAPTRGTPVIKRPGIWVALRPHTFPGPANTPSGDTALAGILVHRTAPKNPLEEPTFKAWRTRLAERFPLTPPPR